MPDWYALSLDPVHRQIGKVVKDKGAPPLSTEEARRIRQVLEIYTHYLITIK